MNCPHGLPDPKACAACFKAAITCVVCCTGPDGACMVCGRDVNVIFAEAEPRLRAAAVAAIASLMVMPLDLEITPAVLEVAETKLDALVAYLRSLR